MKKVLITGISSGLGLELTKIFLENNFFVIGLSKKVPKEFEDNKNFKFIKTNLNCNKSIQRAIENIKDDYDKIDYIFLNAGIWHFEMIENLNFKKIDEIIKVNLSSNIKLISGLFNLIIKNRSKIFILGSINHKEPQINQISYNISKAALYSFSQSLNEEFLEYNMKDCVEYIELDDFESNLTRSVKQKEGNLNFDNKKNLNNSSLLSAKEVAKNIYDLYF